MARGTQLTQMIDMLRYELGKSTDRAAGTQHIDHLRYGLRRTQELLYDEHNWPFLEINRIITLVPYQRLYSLPSLLTPETTANAWVQWGSEWIPAEFGIKPEHYNAYHEGVPTDPVQRWDYSENGLFEVWPAPASPGALRIYGYAPLGELKKDSDRSTLDDLLIVLFTAAEMLDDEARAGKKLSLANSRLRRLKGKLSAAKRQSPASMLGPGQGPQRHPRPGIDYVP